MFWRYKVCEGVAVTEKFKTQLFVISAETQVNYKQHTKSNI